MKPTRKTSRARLILRTIAAILWLMVLGQTLLIVWLAKQAGYTGPEIVWRTVVTLVMLAGLFLFAFTVWR